MIKVNKDKPVRTRYAPSPTGYFHVGGARSALFNYLFAKHYNGSFILRIEDTDIAREVQNGIESQYDNLLWLGIVPDESMFKPINKYIPYIQSKKLDVYKEVAYALLEKKLAYRCFCTTDELEKAREESLANHQTPKYNRHCLHLTEQEINEKLKNNVPYAIRLIIPDNHNYEWDDMVRGKISIPSSALTDFVILKTNGIGSYNFANVIDDHDMQISHIIRGEEHVSNTPYQLAAIDAIKQLDKYKDSLQDFDFIYGHLPIVIKEGGKKLSKRDHTLKQFISDYKEMGFLPISIDNFLVNLGWSSPNNKEYFNSLEEIFSEFDGSRISCSPSTFDFKKMISINKKHMSDLTDEQYLKQVKSFLKIDLKQLKDHEDEILLLFRKDLRYFSDINELIDNLLNPSLIEINDELKNVYDNAKKHELGTKASLLLKAINEWSIENISIWLKKLAEDTSLKAKQLYLPLRYCLFKQEHGPEFVKLVYIFGKDYCLEQLSKFDAIL